MIPTGAFSFFYILHTFFRLDCFLFPYTMQFILLVIFFFFVLHWQIYNIVAINHHYSFFSHWFCLMILFSFLFRCNCKAMWLISSYPPVGGISGQINIFASHIVQVYFGIFFFFLLTGYKSQYHIVLHQFPFFSSYYCFLTWVKKHTAAIAYLFFNMFIFILLCFYFDFNL